MNTRRTSLDLAHLLRYRVVFLTCPLLWRAVLRVMRSMDTLQQHGRSKERQEVYVDDMPRVSVFVFADLQALDFDRLQITSALIKLYKIKCWHPVVLCCLHQSCLSLACQHVHV